MADLGMIVTYVDDVKPNVEVLRLWTDQQIAEKEMRVKRLEADMEEILRAHTAKIQAAIIMLKREVAALYGKKDKLEQYNKGDVIEVKMIEQKE